RRRSPEIIWTELRAAIAREFEEKQRRAKIMRQSLKTMRQQISPTKVDIPCIHLDRLEDAYYYNPLLGLVDDYQETITSDMRRGDYNVRTVPSTKPSSPTTKPQSAPSSARVNIKLDENSIKQPRPPPPNDSKSSVTRTYTLVGNQLKRLAE